MQCMSALCKVCCCISECSYAWNQACIARSVLHLSYLHIYYVLSLDNRVWKWRWRRNWTEPSSSNQIEESDRFGKLLQTRIGRLSLLQQLRNRGKAVSERSAFKETSMCVERGDVHTEVVSCGNVVSRQRVHCHAKTGMLMLCHESLQSYCCFISALFFRIHFLYIYIYIDLWLLIKLQCSSKTKWAVWLPSKGAFTQCAFLSSKPARRSAVEWNWMQRPGDAF